MILVLSHRSQLLGGMCFAEKCTIMLGPRDATFILIEGRKVCEKGR